MNTNRMTEERRSWILCAAFAVTVNALLIHFPRIFASLYCPPNDLYLHYYSAQEFARALSEGVSQPRWAPDMFGGLGAPLFVYYPPLYYYAVSFFHWLTGDMWNAIRAVDFISNSLCGFLVMLFFRKWGMAFHRGWIAAMLVQCAPFFLLNLGYVNGLPWQAANVWMCLLLFAAADDPGNRARLDLRITIAMAGLSLTHLLSTFMALACLPIAILFASWAGGFGWKKVLLRCVSWGASALLGLFLAAFFLLPALTTSSLINTQKWRDELDWRAGFLCPLFTKPTWVIFQYGVGLCLVAGVIICAIAIRKMDRTNPLRRAAVLLISTAIAALFWSSEISYPLWSALVPLQILQYPYCFFQIASIATACVLVLTLMASSRDMPPWLRMTHRLAIVLWFLLAGGIWLKILLRDGRPVRPDIPAFAQLMLNQREYLPARPQKGWQDYLASGALTGECQRAGARLAEQNVTVHRRSWNIVATRSCAIRLPLFAYPCWCGTQDGAPVEWQKDTASGLVICALTAGAHVIEMTWSGWPMQKPGRIVSLAAIAALAVITTIRRGRLLTSRAGAGKA